MFARGFFLLLCVYLLFSKTDAYYGYGLIRCQTTSSSDIIYLEQIYFNKKLVAQYNSTLGKFEGYTKYAKEIADQLNKNLAFMKQEEKNTMKCTSNAPLMDVLLSKTVEPSVRLQSVEAVDSRHPVMLACSVYNFYPKVIKVTWLKDGQTVTSDVTTTDELPNGNWLYQMHSHLEYTPTPGERITCKVEHASFSEPKLYHWDPMSESQREKIAVGAAGLVLGVVILLAGAIYYYNNTPGRELVPTNDENICNPNPETTEE
ncbi:H-2 class II histocompatibility antigen, E-S beta chain-like [Solea solea]|uniref:H-2 class II histocompatibility antigen, E-S beta chain-like n=1 Tax=Solea solea TaxID=90069 RepID=UPI00272BC0EC|nr:H-2 class II histocompatibility antigen, E-S beta chain-like [Solea solea]